MFERDIQCCVLEVKRSEIHVCRQIVGCEFERTLELEPDSPAALYNTAMALSRLGRGDEARPLIQRFVTLYPGRPEAAGAREWLAGGNQPE